MRTFYSKRQKSQEISSETKSKVQKKFCNNNNNIEKEEPNATINYFKKDQNSDVVIEFEKFVTKRAANESTINTDQMNELFKLDPLSQKKKSLFSDVEELARPYHGTLNQSYQITTSMTMASSTVNSNMTASALPTIERSDYLKNHFKK